MVIHGVVGSGAAEVLSANAAVIEKNLEYLPLDSKVPVTQSYIRDTGVLLG